MQTGRRGKQHMTWLDRRPLGGVSYGDVFHQNEVEMSTYNFESTLTRPRCSSGSIPAEESKRPIEWVYLACHEMTLKASHIFNLLDARKAISVTERQRATFCGSAPWPSGGSCLPRRPRRGVPHVPAPPPAMEEVTHG